MITSERSTRPPGIVYDQAALPAEDRPYKRKKGHFHHIACVSLLLACLGMGWFAYQVLLVPQPKSFPPDWHGATWVQAADGNAPVAYFRYAVTVNALPDAVFLTIQSSQNYSLFLNGTFIGSNNLALKRGMYGRAYMYSVTSFIQRHTNVIAVRVANNDEQTPALRLSMGMVLGTSLSYYGTGGSGWQATDTTTLVYPHNAASLNDSTFWTTAAFDSNSWYPVQQASYSPAPGMLDVDPHIYEQPLSVRWMSAGLSHDAYFVREIPVSSGVSSAWMRIVATGNASIFINNQLLVVWNGLPPTSSTDLAYYFSPNDTARNRSGFSTGMYDISPYLHAGENVIAVHVAAPGVSATLNGLSTPNASMSLDVFINDTQNHATWILPGNGWHASHQAVTGWAQGSDASLAWPTPLLINRLGTNRLYYQPDSSATLNTQITALSSLLGLAVSSLAVVIGLWVALSLLISRRYHIPYRSTLELLSLAYLPALACEALLTALAFEPQIARPFPYTSSWALVLVLLVGAGYLMLWRHAQLLSRSSVQPNQRTRFLAPLAYGRALTSKLRAIAPDEGYAHTILHVTWIWLRKHWLLALIVLLAIPLVTYNLAYDPYWQDELTSYYAAKGVLAHGIPVMPSGFFYTKGELYSYALALSMLLFGDQGGAPRILSAVEYLASIAALYGAGCYFFNKRVALLAAAMFAFSPFALSWGREMRMYQQAQLLTILVVYLFYKALQERQRVHLIYLAVGCLIAAYLSHEESFIIFPALVLWVVLASRDEKRRSFAALRQKHWWIAGSIGAGIVIAQLLTAHISHPAVIGTDSSQRPFIQVSADSIPYYTKLLFLPWMLSHSTLLAQLPFMTIHSLLAVMGCFWGMRSKDGRARFCAWFLVASMLTLVLVFTMQSDRYFYPLLPGYYLLTAYALHRVLRALWLFAEARARTSPAPTGRQGQFAEARAGTSPAPTGGSLVTTMMVFTTGLVCACLLILPILPITNYNLLVSHLAGFSYQRQHPDYDNAGQYIRTHWRTGDSIIALSPSLSILYYVGHVDYFFSTDRALYLFERDGGITDTPTGTTPILNQGDFLAVLTSHGRIWIVASGTYQNQTRAQINGKIVFPPDIHLVYEGYASAVYLRGG